MNRQRAASPVLIFAALVLALATSGAAQRRKPPKPKFYKGREIAQTMHFLGAPWLVRESRQREEDCRRLLKELRVQPGQVVCDMGCGNGFYTIPIAERVGPKGKVLAVDIQKPMLTLLRRRAEKAGLNDRIERILGTPTDPKLPKGTVDLILLVDVYHEFSDPEAMLAAMHASLKPNGRIVLAEFRTEDPEVPIKRLHKMSKRQILREIPPNGFRLVRQYDGLPWQHLMFFERQGRDADGLDGKVRRGLRRATEFVRTLAVHGGFAGIHSLDQKSSKQRFGESEREKVGRHEIWLQPPGTPSVAEVAMRAFTITGEDRYFEMARRAGLALAWAQRKAGGWDHRADLRALDEDLDPALQKGNCTFDDNISQGALSALIRLDDVLEERWLTDAVELGLVHLQSAQFANGAWPQWYPLRGGYHDYFTFNDGAINDCIRTLLLAYDRYGHEECLAAALRGGDFILASQLAKPQQGWAQQYSQDRVPAAARRFEPAAVCSAVTVRNLRTLLELHVETGKARFAKPVDGAIDWLERSRGADGQLARFYEIGSNRPVFGDRDGKVYYDVTKLSAERQRGYSWYGDYGFRRVRADWERVRKGGIAAHRAHRTALDSRTAQQARLAGMRKRVTQVLEQLDDRGRWVRGDRIHIGDYVANARLLCEFLELPRD